MQLQQEEETFVRLNVRIVVVTFQDGPLVRAYLDEMRHPQTILLDTDRQLYKDYGMLRANLWHLFGPATWWAYFKELLHGCLPSKPSGDTFQQGGDVLIDPNGIVRFHYVASGPADCPSVSRILRERLSGT